MSWSPRAAALSSAASLAPQGPGSSRQLAGAPGRRSCRQQPRRLPGPGPAARKELRWAPTRSSVRNQPPPRVRSTPLCSARLRGPSPAAGWPRYQARPSSKSPRPRARPPGYVDRHACPGHASADWPRVVGSSAVDAVTVLSADAQANRQASAGAVMSYTAGDGDLRGSAAAACQQPANDLWLVGANTALGRTAVLNLSNRLQHAGHGQPGPLRCQGPDPGPGKPWTPGGPGQHPLRHPRRPGPGQQRLGVRVRSAGGPVAAVIQQSVLRGLTPGGVDFIVPGTAPAVRQVVTGVDIQDPAALAALTAKPGFADAGPALQHHRAGTGRRRRGNQALRTRRAEGPARRRRGHGEGRARSPRSPLAGVPAGLLHRRAPPRTSPSPPPRGSRGGSPPRQASDVAWSPSSCPARQPARGARAHGGRPVPGRSVHRTGGPPSPIRRSRPTARCGLRRPRDMAGGTTASIKVPAERGGFAGGRLRAVRRR